MHSKKDGLNNPEEFTEMSEKVSQIDLHNNEHWRTARPMGLSSIPKIDTRTGHSDYLTTSMKEDKFLNDAFDNGGEVIISNNKLLFRGANNRITVIGTVRVVNGEKRIYKSPFAKAFIKENTDELVDNWAKQNGYIVWKEDFGNSYEGGGSLTPEQYELVRTPAFKNWFGDWENNPEGASKVVDENGEPLKQSHFTNSKFTVFKNKETGFHFGDKSIKEDLSIAKGEDLFEELEVFLNIRNPLRVKDSHRFDPSVLIEQLSDDNVITGEQYDKLSEDLYDAEENLTEDDYYDDWALINKQSDILIKVLKGLGYDGLVYQNKFDSQDSKLAYLIDEDSSQIYVRNSEGIFVGDVVLESKSNKRAIVNFVSHNDNLYVIEEDNGEELTELNKIRIKEIIDSGGYVKVLNSPKTYTDIDLFLGEKSFLDSWVAFDSEQIKLADGSNTTFDENNPDIRFNDGGGVDDEVYIEFLNKAKNFTKDKKSFKTYEDAEKWARKNFDKFNPDMIHYYSGGGDITIDDVDEWEVINDWASWEEIHPKYKVSYGQMVSDINDMFAFVDLEDIDGYYKNWKERYGLKKWDNKEVEKIADILWKDVLETAKKENAFEEYVEIRNEEAKKRMADIPENYILIKRIGSNKYTGETGKYIFRHRGTGKELELGDFGVDNISNRMYRMSEEQALKNYFKNKSVSSYKGGGSTKPNVTQKMKHNDLMNRSDYTAYVKINDYPYTATVRNLNSFRNYLNRKDEKFTPNVFGEITYISDNASDEWVYELNELIDNKKKEMKNKMENGGQLDSVSDMLPHSEPMGVIQPMNIMETVQPMYDGGGLTYIDTEYDLESAEKRVEKLKKSGKYRRVQKRKNVYPTHTPSGKRSSRGSAGTFYRIWAEPKNKNYAGGGVINNYWKSVNLYYNKDRYCCTSGVSTKYDRYILISPNRIVEAKSKDNYNDGFWQYPNPEIQPVPILILQKNERNGKLYAVPMRNFEAGDTMESGGNYVGEYFLGVIPLMDRRNVSGRDADDISSYNEGTQRYEGGGQTGDYSDGFYKMLEEKREQELKVKMKIATIIGIDSAIRLIDSDFVINPFDLIQSAVRKGFIDVEQINKALIDASENEAYHIDYTYRDSGHGIGSSDMNAFIRSMLRSAGIQEKDYANGGGVGSVLVYEYKSQNDYEQNKTIKEMTFDDFQEADTFAREQSNYKNKRMFVVYNIPTSQYFYYGIGKTILEKGGALKPIPEGNKGLPKLPKEVRNRMGYMKNGGVAEKRQKISEERQMKRTVLNDTTHKLINKNGSDINKYSEYDLKTLKSYISERDISEKMAQNVWGLAIQNGFEGYLSKVLIINSGTGNILNYVDDEFNRVDAVNPDKTENIIAGLLNDEECINIYTDSLKTLNKYDLAIILDVDNQIINGTKRDSLKLVTNKLNPNNLLIFVTIHLGLNPKKMIQGENANTKYINNNYRMVSAFNDDTKMISVLKRL